MANQDRMKIFRLFQRKEEVVLGEGEEQVRMYLWKPTSEQSNAGQLYLLGRMEYWQGEGKDITSNIESMIGNMSEDELANMIVEQTVAQKVAENIDLVSDEVRNDLERGILTGMTAEFLDENYTLKPGGEQELVRDQALAPVPRSEEHTSELQSR